MAGDVGESSSHGHGKGQKKYKKRRRMGVRLDMTPMVDVAFLLLTFFMLTTTFATPQAMEINLPPDQQEPIEMPQSRILNLVVRGDNQIFLNRADNPTPEKVPFDNLRNRLKYYQGISDDAEKIAVVVKVSRGAKYQALVDVLDELDLVEMNRFSLMKLTPEDSTAVGAL